MNGSTTPNPQGKPPVPTAEMLELIKWHIDRYDRLRASTSARASALLSANAIIATGSLILVNYYLQAENGSRNPLIEISFTALALATFGLIARSLWSCINAIAARKTTRAMHEREIPTRFLFNWGDTIRAVDGHSSFAGKVVSLTQDEVLNHAVSELWTDILQHKDRHGHLRSAIGTFRYCAAALLALAAYVFLTTLM